MEEEIIIIEEPEQVVEIIDAEAESEKAVVVTPESEIKRFESALSAINSRLTAQEEFNKEVTYTESIDSVMAYKKAIPTAARLGFINKIGGMSRKGINLFDFSKPTDVRAGITSYTFSDDTLTVVGNDTTTYSRVTWNCTELIKQYQGKYLNFSAESFTWSNQDAKPSVQLTIYIDDSPSYLALMNGQFTTGKAVQIPTGNITSAQLGIYTNNAGTRLASTVTLVNPMLLLNEDKGKPYEPYADGLVTSQVESVSIDGKVVQIPAELRKPMYGINETVYDYIDVELKKMVKRCGTYTIDDTSTIYSIEPRTNAIRIQYRINDAASGYTACMFSNLDYLRSWDSEVTHGYMYNNTARVILNGITTQADALTWLRNNPVTVVYELATPVVEDLAGALHCTDIVQPFNCNGGTITFNQTQQQKVEIPNEVRYLTKK